MPKKTSAHQVVSTYLPTKYNDGSEIDRRTIGAILLDAAIRFGGYSLLRNVHGGWRSPDGTLYQEVNDRLEVICPRSQVAEVRAWVIEIGHQLKQEAMYFEVRDSKIEILDTREQ